MQKFDIVIIGGGMVGLSLACGLKNTGLRVAVIERQELNSVIPEEQPALRFSTINAASQRLLNYVKVWNSITAHSANPYYSIEVWERDSFGRIVFDSASLGYPELGYIIENSVIRKALWRCAEQLAEITVISPAVLRKVTWGEHEACVFLDNSQILTAKLVVAADGAYSQLRTYANIPLIFWNYQQYALLAIVRTAYPHSNIARQTFHGEGILAFLPLSDPYLNAIVWSLPLSTAQKYLTLPTRAFNITLSKHINLALGLCELQSERQIFPLICRYARNFAAHRLVVVGDAAHTIHVLSGQGVNLGFMDVAVLLGELQFLRKAGKDIGYYAFLRKYERKRKYSAALMLAGTQILRELFTGHHPIKKWVRCAGLRLTDNIPVIKSRFIKQAMGLNELPDWLVSEPLYCVILTLLFCLY